MYDVGRDVGCRMIFDLLSSKKMSAKDLFLLPLAQNCRYFSIEPDFLNKS